MTTASPRATDPPASTVSRGHREVPAAHTILAERFRLLSMHSFPHLHPELFTHLCERLDGRLDDLANTIDTSSQPFEPHLFVRWEHLLRGSERITSGIVLLDLDEAERSASLHALGISAHRLCELLARELREKPVALVLLTRMDYVEIEDLLRAGVSALLHPGHDVAMLAERVRIAMQRRQRPIATRHPVACEKCHEASTDTVTPAPRAAPMLLNAAPELPTLAPPQSLPTPEQIAPAAP